MSRLGIITGMKTEAGTLQSAARDRPASRLPMVAVTGGNTARAEAAAREFAGAGAAGLVSFGIAGGLDPTLVPGDLLLAEGLLTPGGTVIRTHGSWRSAFAATEIVSGTIYGSDVAISRQEDKAQLFADHGARAVDMESLGVARAAQDAGLPFLIVRAIADPAGRAVPPAALAGLGADGGQRPFAVLGKLLKNPTQLLALIRLAHDAKTALRRLAAVAPAVLELDPD